MNHFQQSLIIKANPAKVYAALTTPQGLQGWWTEDCEVATEVGGIIHFHFGDTHKDMRIEQLEPNREVRWLCTMAHINHEKLAHKNEWEGTQLAFHLTPEGTNATRLAFEHIGLVPSFECYELCSSCWPYFLSSLQQCVETGRGTPFVRGDSCNKKVVNN